ncbi:MAG TPA: hypothetical protein VK590_11690 [Saprospiraceae bacterium]|nr:hypothetical protein [Saprospiraceae bacterium]
MKKGTQLVAYTNEELTLLIPADETPIIRIMSLDELIHILFEKNIRFTRLDKFQDEFEGLAVVSKDSKEGDFTRKTSLISCWSYNINNPMWHLLNDNTEEVAIITTVGDFKRAIKSRVNRDFIIPFLMQYVPAGTLYELINRSKLATRKIDSYKHEKEIRFIYTKGVEKQPRKRLIKLDPTKMIKEIILSPEMSDENKRLIKNHLIRNEIYNIKVNGEYIKYDLNQ